jgi:hypothetical protein
MSIYEERSISSAFTRSFSYNDNIKNRSTSSAYSIVHVHILICIPHEIKNWPIFLFRCQSAYCALILG